MPVDPKDVVATVPSIEQLPEWHPCRFKPIYYAMFVDPVKDALLSAGVMVKPAVREEPGVVVHFEFSEPARGAVAIIDYADQVHVDGLVMKAIENCVDPHVVFKMKPCDRFAEEYAAFEQKHGTLVVPFGYVISPDIQCDPAQCRADRTWFLSNLGALRDVRDATPLQRAVFTRGAFHARHLCPVREKLYADDLDQGGKVVAFQQHAEEFTRAGFVLSASGPDDTIDRKVVEFCAVGAAILTNPGLLDLRLPYGQRFVHGKNCWVVNSPAEVRAVVRSMPEDVWQRLIAGSRAIFDACFSPAAIGQWLVDRACDVAW